ncbi:MAG: ABC transporter permease subunit [Candidatus Micrarchaeaceae archaeon]
MDAGKAYAIAAKDMKETFSSISIYGPMLGVPLFFAFALPILTYYVTKYAAPAIASRFLQNAVGAAASNSYAFMSFFSIDVLGPIFMTLPIITASVIAADSFAGEKERKTSEALLTMPVSNAEFMAGKILASFIPTILLTLLVFGIYGNITNYLSLMQFGTNIIPNLRWVMMLCLAPFLALATIGVVVLVSSHVKGIKEAQQISTLLILPLLAMPFMAIFGIADLTFSFFLETMLVVALLDAAIIYIGIKKFNKEKLL